MVNHGAGCISPIAPGPMGGTLWDTATVHTSADGGAVNVKGASGSLIGNDLVGEQKVSRWVI